VQRKAEAGQPGAGQRQTLPDPHYQARGQSVEGHVEQMISGGVIAPNGMLEPECAVQQRIVLLGCA